MTSIISNLWRRWPGRARQFVFVLADALVIVASLYLAFLLRFEGAIPPRYLDMLRVIIPIALGVKLPIFLLFRIYRFSWAYVGLEDLFNVVLACGVGSLAFAALLFVLHGWPAIFGFPRATLAIDFAFTFLGVGGIRLAKRTAVYLLSQRVVPQTARRALIVGAGDAGEQLVRSLQREKKTEFWPIAFVDDDPQKWGMFIHGVPVIGPRSKLPEFIRSHRAEAVLISMPSAHPRVIRETVELARKGGIKEIKIIPFLSQLYTGEVRVSDLREVQLEELLGREPAKIDPKEIEGYLRGKKVLVTGAAGSIGSELCRQIARFGPKQLIMLDHEETGLFYIDREIRERFPNLECVAVLGDIKDEKKMEWVFTQYKPEVVFHAAAYKHVEMARKHPDEAVKTNIFGTLTVGEAAIKAGCERFILISTDKAVNPIGVMGMTKRVAEMIILDLNSRGQTKFSAVRFGNVLGSRGSVIAIFKEQIKKGGPVTVTHPDMRRYFMLPSEAVLLVLQAGALGKGGEVFVLDMGEPIRILDLAREMIRLSGFEPDVEIPIVFTQPNDDEKMFEDILTAEEGAEATKHKQIYVARMSNMVLSEVLHRKLDGLKALAAPGADGNAIRKALAEIIHERKRPPVSQAEEC